MRRLTLLATILAITGLGIVNFAAAQESVLVPAGAAAAPEKKVFEALEKRIDVDFKDATLEKITTELKEKSGIEVKLDLDTLGITSFPIGNPVTVIESPITFAAKKMRIRSVLAHVLTPMELNWTIRGDALVITSQAEATKSFPARVFAIGDLASPPPRYMAWDRDKFPNMLQRIIASNSWDERESGTMQLVKDQLVVRNTFEVLEEVDLLLSALREVRTMYQKWNGKDRPPGIEKSPGFRLAFPANQAVEKGLDQLVELDYMETPLSDVIEQLQKLAQMQIVIDDRALKNVGIDNASPITFKTKGKVALRAALMKILRPVGLTYRVWNEAIQISAVDDFRAYQELRIYPVFDLVGSSTVEGNEPTQPEPATPEILAWMIERLIAPSTWNSGSGRAVIEWRDEPEVLIVIHSAEVHDKIGTLLSTLRQRMPVIPKADKELEKKRIRTLTYLIPTTTQKGHSSPPPSAEELAKLIPRLVEPESWKESGVELSATKSMLVVRHRVAVQEKVIDLLYDCGVFPVYSQVTFGMGMSGMALPKPEKDPPANP